MELGSGALIDVADDNDKTWTETDCCQRVESPLHWCCQESTG
jgi:hypothetical protein